MSSTNQFESIVPEFSGYDAGDPELWLDRYERYSKQKKWTPEQQASNLPLYLTESASYWHRDLPDEITNTFPTLKQAFLAKYQPHEGMKWVRSAELADRKQRPDETVEAYIADIERRCCQLSKTPAERMEVFIRGLLQDIRSHVIKAHPDNVDDAVTQARLAQSTTTRSGPQTAEVNSELQELSN